MKVFCVVAFAAFVSVNCLPEPSPFGLGGLTDAFGGIIKTGEDTLGGATGGILGGGGDGGGILGGITGGGEGGGLGGLGGLVGGIFGTVEELVGSLLGSLGLGGGHGGGLGGLDGAGDKLGCLKEVLGSIFNCHGLLQKILAAVEEIEELKMSFIKKALSDLLHTLNAIIHGAGKSKGKCLSPDVLEKLNSLPKKLHKCSKALDSIKDKAPGFAEQNPELNKKIPGLSHTLNSASNKLSDLLGGLPGNGNGDSSDTDADSPKPHKPSHPNKPHKPSHPTKPHKPSLPHKPHGPSHPHKPSSDLLKKLAKKLSVGSKLKALYKVKELKGKVPESVGSLESLGSLLISVKAKISAGKTAEVSADVSLLNKKLKVLIKILPELKEEVPDLKSKCGVDPDDLVKKIKSLLASVKQCKLGGGDDSDNNDDAANSAGEGSDDEDDNEGGDDKDSDGDNEDGGSSEDK